MFIFTFNAEAESGLYNIHKINNIGCFGNELKINLYGIQQVDFGKDDDVIHNIPKDIRSIISEQYFMNALISTEPDPVGACNYLFDSKRKTGDKTTDDCCYPIALVAGISAIAFYYFFIDDDVPPKKILHVNPYALLAIPPIFIVFAIPW